MQGVRQLARSSVKKALDRLGYRVSRSTEFPQANVQSFCAKLADQGFRPAWILDVGANRGDWSREARSVFSGAAFTLIEPQEEMAGPLDQFCAETPDAEWIMAGAGSADGELTLAVAPDTVSSSFKVSDEEARAFNWTPRTVPLVTLDGVCERRGAVPEIVKLDVEGFEREVLEGAETLVGKTEVFLLELSLYPFKRGAMVFDEAVEYMKVRGYSVYDFTGFQSRPYDRALALCEVAFARTDGALRSFAGWDKYD